MTDGQPGDAATNHGLLERVLALMPVLLSGTRSRTELLAALPRQGHRDGLSTLNRDLRLLRRLGLLSASTLKSAPARPGPNLPLWATPDESRALAMAWHVLRGLELPEASLLGDLLGRLPVRQGNGEVGPLAVALPPAPGQVDDGVWQTVLAGLEGRRRLSLRYRRPQTDDFQATVLDHARLCWMTGALYLVGIKVTDGTVDVDYRHLREYRLDRLAEAHLLPEVWVHDDLPLLRVEFHVDAVLRDRLVTLQTLEGQAVQEVTPLPDGTLRVVTWETGLLRARQRIFSLGPHVRRVVGPPELLPVLREAAGGLVGALGDRED